MLNRITLYSSLRRDPKMTELGIRDGSGECMCMYVCGGGGRGGGGGGIMTIYN